MSNSKINCRNSFKNVKVNMTRNDLWSAPPFSLNVKGPPRKFFSIIKRNFPKDHNNYNFFNTASMKFSYSVMSNMASVIASSNRHKVCKFLSDNSTPRRSIDNHLKDVIKTSNCRLGKPCHFSGVC